MLKLKLELNSTTGKKFNKQAPWHSVLQRTAWPQPACEFYRQQ